MRFPVTAAIYRGRLPTSSKLSAGESAASRSTRRSYAKSSHARRRAATPMRERRPGSSDELVELGAHRGHVLRAARQNRSRRRPPLRARRHCDPRSTGRRTRPLPGTRCPNPSASSPAQRSRQHIANTSARRRAREGRRRARARGTSCSLCARAARDARDHGPRLRSRAARREDPQRRRSRRRNPCAARGARARARADEFGIETERLARVAARWTSSSGWNRSTSTQGGTITPRTSRPAMCVTWAAGYPPAATTAAAPCSTRRPSCRVTGRRPHTVISAPCATTTYGAARELAGR